MTTPPNYQANTPETDKVIDWPDWLTKIALILALVLVAVRITSLEVVREVMDFSVDSISVAGPGPTTTLLLDLLCWTPALLVLARRAFDRRYTLRLHVSHLLAVLLGAWVIASCFWASDKFQAVVNASTWCAAMALGWAVCQLVRSWTRFRIVAALGVGLAMLFVSQAFIYRYFEWPDTVKVWDQTRHDVMQQRGWTEDDFSFKQFDAKVRRGEMVGFFRSPNTYAAAAAMCALVAIGVVAQRFANGDDPVFPVLAAIPAVLSVGILWLADSRTALAGFLLCAVLFVVAWAFRETLSRRSRLLFAIGCGAVLLGIAAVVAIGLTTGGLFHDSLTFRWNYWIASWALFKQHVLTGVGWSNFGNNYLAFRMPIASEEIRDPHNLFVKFMTETGVIGLALATAWLGRLAWEMTRPVLPRPSNASPQSAIAFWVAVPVAFLLLRLIVNLPLSLVGFEPLKLLMFALLIVVGLIVATARSSTDYNADDRPAPLLLLGVLVALAGFLLHAMVDFALFETGPLLLMMLLVGAVLGIRHPGAAGKKERTGLALAALAAVFFGVIAFAALIVLPISSAEARSRRAAELVGQQRFAAAATELREAYTAAPVSNFDYAARSARYLIVSRQSDPQEILGMLTLAITSDPKNPMGWLERARFRRSLGNHEMNRVEDVSRDYASALALNPNDVRSRLEFADYLASAGRAEGAAEQYRLAIDYNDRLHPDEPKRLPSDRVEQLKQIIQPR